MPQSAGSAGNPASRIPDPWVIIVRNGETRMFRALAENFEERVIWDRRLGERRVARQPVSRESREGERRSVPPETWTAHGFLLAPPGDGA